ncbi:MAG: sulfatase-like hydrolase/transferase [Lentisphaeria bacterium]|nr:sulfatase-like hydrolase/transferase [Lentisphaeria bacterium]
MNNTTKYCRREFLKYGTFAGIGAYLSTQNLFSGNLQSSITKPNLLFIITDQQRFDALGAIQNELPQYKGKTKLRTPNLDRLMQEGVRFENAYSQCAVCAPTRVSIRTGCTIERHGMQTNQLVNEDVYKILPMFENKIKNVSTFEQILVESFGYVSEHYGKWHMPKSFYKTKDGTKKVITNNYYNMKSKKALFSKKGGGYTEYLSQFKGEIPITLKKGQQINKYSGYPYTPIKTDIRYKEPTTPTGFKKIKHSNSQGRDSLPEDKTSSFFQGTSTVNAIDRLSQGNKPFVLTTSFHSPHAPMIATGKYFDYYWERRQKMFVSPSIKDTMDNSSYKAKGKWRLPDEYRDPSAVKEWMVPYYALCEEIDHHIGLILKKLDEKDLTKNTLIIFTSDHGEMLGAHGLREKNRFLEESAHVPLIVKYKDVIPAGLKIQSPVTTMDIFATVLDYLGASSFDKSDSKSLRRHIENRNWNERYDDDVVITEWDSRAPRLNKNSKKEKKKKKPKKKLMGKLGRETNFMVRKGNYKLMLTKLAKSNRLDMMYDIESDPFEMKNLVGKNGLSASEEIIGKAEHLKCLLLEWMLRMDGPEKYFSDPKYNFFEGEGDYTEIDKRREWKKLDLWISDKSIRFGKRVFDKKNAVFKRNEYLYLGRTTAGKSTIKSIELSGDGKKGFSIPALKKSILHEGKYIRIKISYSSANEKIQPAKLVLTTTDGKKKTITLS